MATAMRPFFEDLSQRYNSKEWLTSDPVQFAHRYSRPADQEAVAFLAACFAYGSVVLVHRALEAVLKPMGESPERFIREYNRRKRYWPGFYHRFHREEHLEILILTLQAAFLEFGSLGKLFQKNTTNAEEVLNTGSQWLRNTSFEIAQTYDGDLKRGLQFFFSAPSDGSACKRMNMFMRWMVRKDEIDLGLWTWFSPKNLVIPVDTHVARIGYYLRLYKGKESRSVNWKLAIEITDSLRLISPADPVRYDFAIARLGILDICKREYEKSICTQCPVQPACRFS